MTRVARPRVHVSWRELPQDLKEKVLEAGSHKTLLAVAMTDREGRAAAQGVLDSHAAPPAPMQPGGSPPTLGAWAQQRQNSPVPPLVWSAALEASATTPTAAVTDQAIRLHAVFTEFQHAPAIALRYEPAEMLLAHAAQEQRAAFVALAQDKVLAAAQSALGLGEFVLPQAVALLRKLHAPQAVDVATSRRLFEIGLAGLQAHPPTSAQGLAVTKPERERQDTLLATLALAGGATPAPGEQAFLLDECVLAMCASHMMPDPEIGRFARDLCARAAQGPSGTRDLLGHRLQGWLGTMPKLSDQAKLLTLCNVLYGG